MNELWTAQGNNFRMNISGTEYEVSTHFDSSGRQSLFAGLLYCPDCGAKLHFCAAKSLKPNQEFYRCANYNSERGTCKIHYIRNVVLEEIVLETVSSLADYVRYINRDKTPLYENVLMLEGILTFSYKGASPALMGACAERGIGLTFLTPRGRFLARVCGSERGNVLLRREQYRRADSLSASCLIARNFIFGKVYNQRWVLERTIRDHALRVNVQALKDVSAALAAKLPQIESAVDLDGLRGLEGDASADYFSVFDEMILNQKADFLLNGRNRRPPQDNMNALLSFAYVLLANDCAAALESVGLDAYVGFMHRDRPGRTSLALDLMEELRAPMADRLCITLVNNRVLQDKHFDRQESGAVFLNDAGRKQFLTAWQNRKREEIIHPFLKEKIMWGLVPYVQALLLARTLRGDTDGYPPFLWK